MARSMTPKPKRELPDDAVDSFVDETVHPTPSTSANQEKPTTQVMIRLTQEEKRRVDEAARRYADQLGVPVSKQVFLRSHLMQIVSNVLSQ